MKNLKYFFKRMKELYLLMEKLFLITVGDLIKEIRKIPGELISLPPFRAYHEFVCFGLLSVSGIIFTENSPSLNYYRTKKEEISKVLKEIEEMKKT